MCKKHLLEDRRHGHNNDHVPSWKEGIPIPTIQQKCSTLKCENQSPNKLNTPMFTSHDKLMEILGIKQTAETNQLFVLCGKHYNETYATIYGSHVQWSHS